MAFGKTAATIVIGAALGSTYASTFVKAEKPAVKLGQAYAKTNKKLAAVKDVVKYKSVLNQLKEKQEATGGSSKQLAAGIETVTQKYKKAKREAKGYGIQIGQIAAEQRKLARQAKFQGMGAKGLNQFKQGKSVIKSTALSTFAEIGAIALPVKVAADFQREMSTVKALTGAVGSEFTELTANARMLGRTTVFSAGEAAQGMSFLGQKGFKTSEIIKTMPGLLNLAAAGGTELGETADISAGILKGFNLEAKDMTRVGDVLAKTFTSSSTDLRSLGEAMTYVAPVAASLRISVEETSAVMGILGNAQITGSMAGTTFRKMLTSISAPASDGAKVLSELNIETKDLDGNLRPLGSILKEFARETENMGNAQKTAYVKAVFGERAIGGVMKLLSKGELSKLETFTNSLNNSGGTAEKIAKIKLDNFHGDLKLIGSILADIGITIGNVVLPPLRMTMQLLGWILAPIGWVLDKCPLLTNVIVGLGIGLLFTTKVLPLVKAGLLLVSGGFKALTAAMMTNPVSLIITAIAVAALVVIEYWEPICGFFKWIWDVIVSVFSWAWGHIKNNFLNFSPIGLVIKYWEPICGFFKWIWDVIVSVFSWAWGHIKNNFLNFSPIGLIIKYWEPIKGFFGGLWDFILGGAKAAFNWILGKLEVVGSAWKTVKGWFGFGDDNDEKDNPAPEPPGNARVQAALEQARASSPAMQLARNSSQKSINNNQSITINTQPGQNTEEIAEMVLRKQQEIAEDRKNGGMYDDEFALA